MKWIDIKDRLPEKGIGVLVTNGKVAATASLDYLNGRPWWWDSHGFYGAEWEFEFSEHFGVGDVTHWMPLPPLPTVSVQLQDLKPNEQDVVLD